MEILAKAIVLTLGNVDGPSDLFFFKEAEVIVLLS
jgi:hypothetical protein